MEFRKGDIICSYKRNMRNKAISIRFATMTLPYDMAKSRCEEPKTRF